MSSTSIHLTGTGASDAQREQRPSVPAARAPLGGPGSVAGNPHRPGAAPAGQDWTERLVGDAAAELRGPLAQVAESIRAVASGELGQLSRLQRDCLADASAACQRIDQMISGLRRLNQQQNHRPGVTRCWFDLDALRDDVDRAIAVSLPHRRVLINWHGIQRGQYRVFGDPARACLLLVSLLSTAIQRTPKGHRLLVRATQAAGDQMVKLAVIDDRIICETDSHASVQKRPEWEVDTMVQIALWRQLTAALLTQLATQHRSGRGREVSFELPAAGLRSVAMAWARWRMCHTGRLKPRKRTQSHGPAAATGEAPLHCDQATLLTVTAGATVSPQTVEAFDFKLQNDSRTFDLVYRISPRRWLVIWDASIAQSRTRIEQLASAELNTASPLRLTWSGLSELPIREGQTAIALADRLARESLRDNEADGFYVEQAADGVQPRLAPSTTPGDRLEAELKHLVSRIGSQNDLLQRQAKTLRQRRSG